MDAVPVVYAHTLSEHEEKDWEPLYGERGHAERVVREMEHFPNPFPFLEEGMVREWLRLLACWHDLGKANPDFQHYLRRSHQGKPCASVDHKHAAAKWVCDCFPRAGMGILLAYAFAGHHHGLPKGSALFEDLPSFRIPESVMQALPEAYRNLRPAGWLVVGRGSKTPGERAFALSMAVRMLHSCLVDADWLATENFMDAEASAERRSLVYDTLPVLSERLEIYLHTREEKATGRINRLRKEIHHACWEAASREGGVFRLNVPTGGGKTLSSLSYALRHAVLQGRTRVIYVIPYTSIIDQTAMEFRRVLGADNVLEHQSNLRTEVDTKRNRYAAENWDAPVIVTTSVQFFESLFSSRNGRCRKLHNIVRSVIIFDEAQSLPATLLAPCLAAMKVLQRDYGCTLLLCTATQPKLTNWGKFDIGWEESEVQSLLGEAMEERLTQSMKRVELVHLGTMTQAELIAHFRESGVASALFIVNFTRQAQDLYRALEESGCSGLYHLSARMCPAHRLRVLEEVNRRLEQGKPVVLVATRVVEAGVDLSFPVVYRDQCGLDSLAQAAGRCNRHGEAEKGLVFSFLSEEFKTIPEVMTDLRDACYAMEDVREAPSGQDLFSPEAVELFFREWYSRRGDSNPGWDREGVLTGIGKEASMVKSWDFPEMEKKFRMIPDGQRSLLVPYGEDVEMLRHSLLELDALHKMPGRELFRRVQQLSVSVYENDWKNLPISRIHEGAGLCMLESPDLYDENIGLLRVGDREESYVV